MGHPDVGHPPLFVTQRFPFSVIYLDDPELVTIVAVAHSKRKPGYWDRV
jgi:hypothetical protein